MSSWRQFLFCCSVWSLSCPFFDFYYNVSSNNFCLKFLPILALPLCQLRSVARLSFLTVKVPRSAKWGTLTCKPAFEAYNDSVKNLFLPVTSKEITTLVCPMQRAETSCCVRQLKNFSESLISGQWSRLPLHLPFSYYIADSLCHNIRALNYVCLIYCSDLANDHCICLFFTRPVSLVSWQLNK